MNLSLLNHNIVMYVDDTVIYGSKSSLTQLENESIMNINSVMIWCRNFKLSINFSKTKAMIFSPKSKEKLILKELNVENHCIEIVNEYNYLGLKIDEKLNFLSHIKTMIRNLGYKIDL